MAENMDTLVDQTGETTFFQRKEILQKKPVTSDDDIKEKVGA
jgi:hypothetical protein